MRPTYLILALLLIASCGCGTAVHFGADGILVALPPDPIFIPVCPEK